jgi:hypothetical protein
LTVTSALLEDCGFIGHTAKDEQSVIYIKTVEGKDDSLDRMLEQKHEGTRAYAKRMRQFLADPARPAHLLDLPSKYLERDLKRPTFYHIGRFIGGVKNRRKGENVGAFDPVAGGRPWSSAVYNSHGDHSKIRFYPLVDHSSLTGSEWFRRMVSLSLCSRLTSDLGRNALAVLHLKPGPY